MVSGKNNSFGSDVNNTDFSVENLLTYRSMEESGNFWLGPNLQPAEFVLELCKRETIRRLRIVNTQGGELRNRGTKEFKVLLSTVFPGTAEDWTEVHQDTLEDPTEKKKLDVRDFNITPTMARFVKFELLSFYKRGGGLQYFEAAPGKNK